MLHTGSVCSTLYNGFLVQASVLKEEGTYFADHVRLILLSLVRLRFVCFPLVWLSKVVLG